MKCMLNRFIRVALIFLDLEKVIAVLFLKHFQKRTLCKNGVACQKFQRRIGVKKFFQMFLQTAGFIGFVTAYRLLLQGHFDVMHENVEHEKGIAVFVFHLLGGFSVDGGSERIGFFRQDQVEKLGEGFLELLGGNTSEISRESGVDRWFGAFEAERGTPGCANVF